MMNSVLKLFDIDGLFILLLLFMMGNVRLHHINKMINYYIYLM